MTIKFKEGTRVTLEDLYSGKCEIYTITERCERRAVLIDMAGRTKIASITNVSHPRGECLDVTGYNAVFSDSRISHADDPDGRGKRRVFKDEHLPQVRQMCESGLTVREIACAFDVSEGSVRRFLTEHGLTSGKPVGRPLQMYNETEDDVQRIQKMLDEGVSVSKISRNLLLHNTIVRRIILKHGLKAKPPKHRPLSAKDIPTIKMMIRDGCTQEEIGDYFKTAKQNVSAFIRRHGLDTEKKSKWSRKKD